MIWASYRQVLQSGGRIKSALASRKISRMLFKLGGADYYKMRNLIKPALVLGIVGFCMFEFVLIRQSTVFRESDLAFLSPHWMLLACLVIWCGTFLVLTFDPKDLPLIGLMLIAIVADLIGCAASRPATDTLVLSFSATLGKGASFALKCRKQNVESEWESRIANCELRRFLVGLTVLLAFASWWHLDMTGNFYDGPRWMGLWNNPNDYGLLMGAGVVLATGLLTAGSQKSVERQSEDGRLKMEDGAERQRQESGKAGMHWKSAIGNWQLAMLLIAAFMMGVGLVMSYSRGAWIATAIGLLYLARQVKSRKEKLESRNVNGSRKFFLFSAFCFLLLIFAACFFWHTPQTAPWYFQRLDLSRGSVQHRVAAWKAGFQIMRDHPFGVGWNKTVSTYQEDYSPPEGGARAITTNDYLMLGTQLGIPALVCFVAYVGLCLRSPRSQVHSPQSEKASADCADWRRLFSAVCFLRKSAKSAEENMSVTVRVGSRPAATLDSGLGTADSRLRVACRAGALVCLVAFWFDGGLFKLATASVFWILLELGAETRFKPQMDTDEHRFGDGKEGLKPVPSADGADSADPKQESASIREIRGLSLTASLPRKRIHPVSSRFLRPLAAIRMHS